MILAIKNNSAFTLLEMSVVVLILSILAWSTLVSNNIISSAETSLVIKEIRYYESFIEGYSHKYKALPGDDPLFISHFNDTELSYFEDIIPLGMNGEGDGKVNSTSQTTTTGFAE